MQTPVRLTAPLTTPVSLAEAKTHCRVGLDQVAEDALITGYIEAATDRLDGWAGLLGRCLVDQRWSVSFSLFPWSCAPLRLPLSPVKSVDAVRYHDADGVARVVAPADYLALSDAVGPYLKPAPGAAWPGTQDRDDAVTIEFTAGYGAAADVPVPIKQAILLLVCHWYDNRGTAVIGTISEDLPQGFDPLVAPYRRWAP